MTEPQWGFYPELHPDTLARLIDDHPIAVVPWGALEWHGSHLPLGMDGIAAQFVAEQLVQRTGGVLLPMMWWPMTTLPHRFSLQIATATMQALINDMLASLAKAGFRYVVLLSGHYAQGHEIELMNIARAAYETHGLTVLTMPPGAAVNEDYLDHAGRWETAQTLALRPDLVRLDTLGPAPLHPRDWAVLGEDPRAASAAEGRAMLESAVAGLAQWVTRMQQPDGFAQLTELYATRTANYHDYVEHYLRTSWEQALADWWQKRTQE